MFNMSWKSVLVGLLVLVFSDIFALEYLSGVISRSTTWKGIVYINGDVTVPRDVILTIEPGTIIYFKPKTDVLISGKDNERSELIVQGSILAKSGNPQSPILFTSESNNPQMNDWYGIIIKEFYNTSILQNCIIEFGYRGITCTGSSPQIDGCEIRFNHNSGISCEVRSSPVVTRSLIYGNGFAGINCELASSPKVSESTLTQNNYGIIIFSRSTPDLGKYPIRDDCSKGENRIHNNFNSDIYNHSVSQIYAQNNYWNTTNPNDIAFTLFDKNDNASYGEIVFLPVFIQRKPYVQSPMSIAYQGESQSKVTIRDTFAWQSSEIKVDSARVDSAGLFASTVPVNDNKSSSIDKKVEIETAVESAASKMHSFTESRLTNPGELQPQMREPILEAFLDSGKREYINRTKPKYPLIYRSAQTNGDVIIEVVVDRQGKIEEYRVLKSDGIHFTRASVDALKQFLYKPGKLNGKPVKFKVVEFFRFKLSGS